MQIHRVKYKDIEQAPQFSLPKNFKTNFQGSSPAPFIGRFGYPTINVGLLSPQFSGDTSHYDSPTLWSKANFSINSVASLRYGLVNSQTTANVKQLSGRLLGIIQEVGMASKAVELEVNLAKAPQLSMKPEKEIIPFGPRSEIRKAAITANSKIDQRVEKCVRDTDLKAAPALLDLYTKGFEQNFLTKLISVGNLGLKNNRKLVPTRWSITAVDDTVGKTLITEIKDLPTGDYSAYFGGSWGNYYLLLFFPEVWSYELFETYLNQSINPWSKNGYAYSTDYENYDGRKEYAEETAGGYYACRFSVLEKMKELKRQHSCLALRFITSEYNIPLGVWVCREATKKSTQQFPLTFASQELLLHYAREFIQRKFGFKLDLLLEQSRLLKEKKVQKKLTEF
ncbi:hypothetical protein HYT55_01160 [Candidatus Woesearchaeota archaeon]|nr:hypothetical protein [Candidatus Woesearchaeota archaeon]